MCKTVGQFVRREAPSRPPGWRPEVLFTEFQGFYQGREVAGGSRPKDRTMKRFRLISVSKSSPRRRRLRRSNSWPNRLSSRRPSAHPSSECENIIVVVFAADLAGTSAGSESAEFASAKWLTGASFRELQNQAGRRLTSREPRRVEAILAHAAAPPTDLRRKETL
jgi:hypothetical protein